MKDVPEAITTRTILNVDDDDIGRYTVSHLLKQHGFTVAEGASGAEALRLARSNPDLILLDVNMPDMDGFEVCRRLKADPATKIIPVLHLSATSISPANYVAGLEGGADGYLTQPVDPPVLLATINALLRMRRAEEALQDVARQWQTTFDSLRDGVCLIDAAGRVQRCNHAMEGVLGRAPGEVVGNSYDVLASGLRSCFGGDVLGALRRVGKVTEDLCIGDSCFVVTAHPVSGDEGATNGAVLVFADISERKQVERMREEHLSLISHDLRNPLTSIIGLAGFLRQSLERNGMSREAKSAELMLVSARRMNNMIQELVDLTRLESGQMKMRKERIDLLRVVTQLLDRVGGATDRARIQVETREPALPAVADPDRIERAVTNLVSNALKFSPPEAPVTVRLERRGDQALIAVADRGVGIPPDDLPHLFTRFYRSSTASQHEGLGLGLYITRLIAEAHGGEVCVESEPGKGSAFYLSLPVASSAPSPLPAVE